jgi:hypothetical protein
MLNQRTKGLGIYLVAASTLQIFLYLALSLSPEKYDWLFYFDPRIGIFFLETAVRGAEQVAPGLFRWSSAIWILLLGLLMFGGRPLVKTYIAAELFLVLPNIVFFFAIVRSNLSPVHGFSIGELVFPVIVMLVFSLVPLVLAFRIWRRNAQDELSNAAGA